MVELNRGETPRNHFGACQCAPVERHTHRRTMHDDDSLVLWPLEAFGGGIFVTLQSVKQTWKKCTACGDYSMWRFELKILIYSSAKHTKSTFLICILEIDWPRWTAWRCSNHEMVGRTVTGDHVQDEMLDVWVWLARNRPGSFVALELSVCTNTHASQCDGCHSLNSRRNTIQLNINN